MGRDLAKRAKARIEQAGAASPASATTLREQIISMRDEFQRAMPRGLEATQLIRDALTCLRATPSLARCHDLSVLGGLMTCAQLGLRPGVPGLGHAWLLPMWHRRENRFEATLIIGYRGYVELAYRHPKVITLESRVVYEGDYFEMVFGLHEDTLVHRPALDGLPGKPRLFYALARIAGGGAVMTEPWSVARMEAHRDQYAMARDRKTGEIVGPWQDHFVEMGRKTMIRNPLMKIIPVSTDLALGAAVDAGVRINIDPTADPAEVTTPASSILEAEALEEEAKHGEAGKGGEDGEGDPLHYTPDEVAEGGAQ